MEKVVFKATKRTVTGKQVAKLRRAGQLPAVIYGHGIEPIIISLDAHSTGLIVPKLTSYSIVDIELACKLLPASVRENRKTPIQKETKRH